MPRNFDDISTGEEIWSSFPSSTFKSSVIHPDSLEYNYKQYKTDSDAVATWLATTAQKCGYPRDLLTVPATPQQKAPKLKGRARKLARDAAQNKSSDSQSNVPKPETTPETPKYSIPVNDFIALAEWVVKSTKPLIEVPVEFVTVLDRAITVRKRHNDWWYSQEVRETGNGADAQEANQSHGHFIGVLEKVREVLRPRMPTRLADDHVSQLLEPPPTSKKTTAGQITNLFENLEIEEPSDSFLQTDTSPPGPTTGSIPQVQYGVDQGLDIEEVYFAVHCLFNDFDNLRRYLQAVWSGYAQGAFDLVAASITTDTAIDFARQLQEDFVASFPKHSDFEKHIQVLYVQLCLANDQDPETKARPDDEMNFDVYEAAERMLFPAYMLVSSFKDVLEPGVLPMFKPGHFGVYDPSSDRKTKSSRDKFREDKIVILETLPDFCVLTYGPGITPAEDEMTRGMHEMVKLNTTPIWLVFAAQTFLDVHHILRDQVSRGYYELVRSATYVETNIKNAMKFHQNLRVDTWPKSNDQGLLQILERITHWVKTDIVHDTRARLMRSSPVPPPPAEPFFLLKQHPLYCGLLSYNIKASAQEAGLVFANAWGSVLYSAHLYNALRQEQLITNAWKDMDLALVMHKTEQMFVGGFPRTVDEYFKRFLLAMGYSATAFAKNRRPGGLAASKAGPRGLDDLCPVSGMFKGRYCYNEARINLTPNDVDKILTMQADDDDDSEVEETGEWTTPKIKINVPDQPSSNPPTNGSRSSKSHKRKQKTPKSAASGVRPIQLLNALLNAVQSEMLELSFDHFRLHTFSWRLLRSLKENLEGDLRDIYGPGFLDKENQLPFIVGYIFMTAVQTSKLAGVLVPKKKEVVTSRLLVKAAAVMKEMLESGAGEIEMMMLQKGLGMDVEVPDFAELVGQGMAEGGGAGQHVGASQAS